MTVLSQFGWILTKWGKDMVSVMVLTVLIVIAIYIYMHHAAKRNRAADIDSVKAYHKNYKRDMTRKKSSGTDGAYRTYVTKYNNSEDYRERNGL